MNESVYGTGDIAFSAWLDWIRRPSGFSSLKSFFKAKMPNASDDKLLGSDVADIYFGLTADWRYRRWRLSALGRMDIVGQDEREQWDYLTLGVQSGVRLTPSLELLFDGWHRDRSTNTTSLISLGLRYRLNPSWDLECLAGDGHFHRFESNPDSRLERQFSVRAKWRFLSKRMKKWTGNR